VDEIRNLDSMMNERKVGRVAKKTPIEHDELMQHPEVREKVSELILKHWEGWISQKIPALGGKTPKNAAKSADGREAVEALLRDAERDRGQDHFTADASRRGVRRTRELLGLNKQ
jgi:hypothetical protein